MMHVAVAKATLQEKVHCWLQYNGTKCKVIENKICEGTDCLKAAWSSDVTSLECIVAPARIVGWRSYDKVLLLYVLPLPSTMTCVVKTQGSKHSWFTPLMRFSIHTADKSLLPWLFLRFRIYRESWQCASIHNAHLFREWNLPKSHFSQHQSQWGYTSSATSGFAHFAVDCLQSWLFIIAVKIMNFSSQNSLIVII